MMAAGSGTQIGHAVYKVRTRHPKRPTVEACTVQTRMMASRMKARTNEIADLSVNNCIIQPKQTQSFTTSN